MEQRLPRCDLCRRAFAPSGPFKYEVTVNTIDLKTGRSKGETSVMVCGACGGHKQLGAFVPSAFIPLSERLKNG